MLRPARPEKARVSIVSSGIVVASASAQAALVFASGLRSRAVPTVTALAPSVSAAAIVRPSAMPPAATTGTSTASATAGSSAKSPTERRSASLASKAPR